MPIRIPHELPAYKALQEEKIFVMPKERAEHQDIRPLKIIILNIMPKKIETETQLMRLLSNTPLQVDIELLNLESHKSKNTPVSHLSNFYTNFEQIKNNYYDGMIITGAPVEQLEFEQVDYWNEICSVMEWSKTNVFQLFISAGEHRPGFTIISGFLSISFRTSFSVYFLIRWKCITHSF